MNAKTNDLSTIRPNEDILEITHPKTDAILGVRVGLRSIDDEALQRVKRQIRDARNRLHARNKNFTAKEEEENEKLLIFTAMTFWEWYIPEIEPERRIPAKLITPERISPALVLEPQKTILAHDDQPEQVIPAVIQPEQIIPAVYEPEKIIPAVMGVCPTFHGEVPTFNQKRVYEVFEELQWFQTQLAEKCGETKSFFQ